MKKILQNMLRRVLRRFGYLKVDYGCACGRHWVSIDGHTIAQASGEDVPMRDEDVHRLGYVIMDHGKYWDKPEGIKE